MKNPFIKIIKYLLLAFVAVSVGILIFQKLNPPEMTTFPENVSVIVCHATARCPTCRAIEAGTKKCLEEFFSEEKLFFTTLNYEAPENRIFAEKYKVSAATVVLLRRQNGKEEGVNLVSEVWETAGDEVRFMNMLHEKLEHFLKCDSDSEKTDEIIIDLPENLIWSEEQ